MSLSTLLIVLGIPSLVCGLDINYGQENELDSEGRLLFLPGNLNVGLNTNVTLAAAFAAALAAAFASILSLIGLALMALFDDDKGHGGYGYDSYSSGGSSYRRMFGGKLMDWETVSMEDWLSAFEEVLHNFDPSDPECQKRMICEIHQHPSELGPGARASAYIFSYLQYFHVLRLPEELEALIQEYIDAAERGKTLKKDCGEIYNDCQFSVRRVVQKLHHPKSNTI